MSQTLIELCVEEPVLILTCVSQFQCSACLAHIFEFESVSRKKNTGKAASDAPQKKVQDTLNNKSSSLMVGGLIHRCSGAMNRLERSSGVPSPVLKVKKMLGKGYLPLPLTHFCRCLKFNTSFYRVINAATEGVEAQSDYSCISVCGNAERCARNLPISFLCGSAAKFRKAVTYTQGRKCAPRLSALPCDNERKELTLDGP